MIRTATRDDLPRIAALLKRANDAPYDIVRVAEEKCFGLGVAGEPEVRIACRARDDGRVRLASTVFGCVARSSAAGGSPAAA